MPESNLDPSILASASDPIHTGCATPRATQCKQMGPVMSMGVFTLPASNIKGFAFEFAYASRPASSVNGAWSRLALGVVCLTVLGNARNTTPKANTTFSMALILWFWSGSLANCHHHLVRGTPWTHVTHQAFLSVELSQSWNIKNHWKTRGLVWPIAWSCFVDSTYFCRVRLFVFTHEIFNWRMHVCMKKFSQ